MAKPLPLETLKAQADLPQTLMGRALAATPVIMTVIATLLAGLASSEMTKAQYQRAYGAQLQSRAGDQWAFFQAKRLRGEMQRNTLEVLGAAGAREETAPPLPPVAALPADIQAGLDALRADAAPATLNPLLLRIADKDVAEALREAKARSALYDTATAPKVKELEQAPAARRLGFNAARYDEEAKLTSDVARLYELQVAKANAQAERHHLRSQRFFFGMLAAQAAVIVATFALAARKRNLLWGVAAGAGLVAVAFAIYVYLYV